MVRLLRANSIVGPVPGFAGIWVRRARWCRRDVGSQSGCGSERLGVDVGGVEADHGQAGADLFHERCRPAEVCLGVARWLELGEHRRGETAGAVEVAAFAVTRIGGASASWRV
jgi:hypothetical protein